MKKLFAVSVIASVLAASTAFALERPATQPKGTEGPDIRQSVGQPSTPTQPVKGVEGSDVR